ncbi:MAG: hypothetical protein ICV83_07480 [Cytophagales bacterium]|nr:hypothetical protein [Cytophagales bacterium]
MVSLVLMAAIGLWQVAGPQQQAAQANLPRAETDPEGRQDKNGQDKKKKGKKKGQGQPSAAIGVVDRWEVPAVLREISGIAYLGPGRFACVQDEAGTIFIYNAVNSRLERQIPFAGAGDYEGITLVGNTAYVINSSGNIYEIADLHSPTPKVQQFTTPLTGAQNVEGLCYDPKHHRLLVAPKGADPHGQDFKGIYAFDLTTRTMKLEPVFKIRRDDPVLGPDPTNKPRDRFQPSDIGVHPLTGEVYITDAVNTRLFLLAPDGKPKASYFLGGEPFSQPEGITFSPKGEVFISNEGKKQNGNILQVQIDSSAAE